jgi:hypothetical protein
MAVRFSAENVVRHGRCSDPQGARRAEVCCHVQTRARIGSTPQPAWDLGPALTGDLVVRETWLERPDAGAGRRDERRPDGDGKEHEQRDEDVQVRPRRGLFLLLESLVFFNAVAGHNGFRFREGGGLIER